MKKIKFDYGKDGLDITLDPEWNVEVFHPEEQEVIPNPINAIKEATRNPIGSEPLETLIKKKKKRAKICIVVSDATRPVPSHVILQGLIKELNDLGIKDEQIFVLIATGLHRPSREDELHRIMGSELRKRIEAIDHVAKDEKQLVNLGTASDGVPIWINKHFMESDLKILTGYVEPHFFAGFSGGRKAVVPGIAGQATIQGNHSAENIASSFARFGIYEQNPHHQNSMEIAKKVGVDFIVNVCINEKHQITKITAGDLEEAHEVLVDFQLSKVFRPIEALYDIVVCGNGGYPLDLNLYQAVKSMAIGELAVKEEGTIISVNECSDGVGQEKFEELINLDLGPAEIYEKVLNEEILVPDQWEIQVLARVLMKADVVVVSSMNPEELGTIGLKHARSVEQAIEEGLKRHGKSARILILPNGPQVLPRYKE